MFDSASVLVAEVVELVPVDSVVDSDVPLTSGGCSFLGSITLLYGSCVAAKYLSQVQKCSYIVLGP